VPDEVTLLGTRAIVAGEASKVKPSIRLLLQQISGNLQFPLHMRVYIKRHWDKHLVASEITSSIKGLGLAMLYLLLQPLRFLLVE
jgi:hypothetical protein